MLMPLSIGGAQHMKEGVQELHLLTSSENAHLNYYIIIPGISLDHKKNFLRSRKHFHILSRACVDT